MDAPNTDVEKVLSFLPAFRDGRFATAEEHFAATQDDIPDVNALIRAINDSGLMETFDWPAWSTQAIGYFEAHELLMDADVQTIGRLFTTIVRQDRFVGGSFATHCSSGFVQALLERLVALGRPRPTDAATR